MAARDSKSDVSAHLIEIVQRKEGVDVTRTPLQSRISFSKGQIQEQKLANCQRNLIVPAAPEHIEPIRSGGEAEEEAG